MDHELPALLRQKAAETAFSGVVSVRGDGCDLCEAFGYRDGPNRLPNTIETRFGSASITKGFTALGIAKLIEAGELGFETPAKTILGARLKGLNSDITVSQLLSHRSGIGDYLDEEKIDDIEQFDLAIPPQKLLSPLDYLPLIEAERQKFEPGARFSYSNSGYILLAVIVELVTGQPYQDFIEGQILRAAGMDRSGFFRFDSLPENTAFGYLNADGEWRTNLFKLPIRGGGDGGAFTTAGDMSRFWAALLQGDLIRPDLVDRLLTPGPRVDEKGRGYGLGFWLDQGG